jgi:hypothetical protein
VDVRIRSNETLVRRLLDQLTERIHAKRQGTEIPQSPLSSLSLRGKIDQLSYFVLRKNDPNNPVQDVKFKEIA